MFDHAGSRRRYLPIVLGLLVTGILLGVFLARGIPKADPAPEEPGGTTNPPVAESRDRTDPARSEAAVVPDPVIRSDTAVVVRDYYPRCGEESREVQRPSPAMIGLSRGLFAMLEPDGEVLRFDSEQVEVLRVHGLDEGDRFCREQARFRTLGIKDGRVTVFYGTRPGGPVKQVTSIMAQQLTPADRRRLEAGIVVRGDEEVFSQLEGMEQ